MWLGKQMVVWTCLHARRNLSRAARMFGTRRIAVVPLNSTDYDECFGPALHEWLNCFGFLESFESAHLDQGSLKLKIQKQTCYC